MKTGNVDLYKKIGKITLYHGTDKGAIRDIKKSGYLLGREFTNNPVTHFTPNLDEAVGFAGPHGVVYEIERQLTKEDNIQFEVLVHEKISLKDVKEIKALKLRDWKK